VKTFEKGSTDSKTDSTRVARFFLAQHTKTGKIAPKYKQLYPMTIRYNEIFLPKIYKNCDLWF
jgi:hypothetical protein